MEISASKPNETIKIKSLKGDAHWKWMSAGWESLKLSRKPSLLIGLLVTIISIGILVFLYVNGLGIYIPAAIGAFAFIGPLLATFVYRQSRKLEDKKQSRNPKSPLQIILIGLTLLNLVTIWALIAFSLYAIATSNHPIKEEIDFMQFVILTPEGVSMAVIGTIIGAILSIIGFSISAISIPLAFDRNISAFSAMGASVYTVFKNPMAMFSWAFVISMMVALSAFLLFLPLVIIFPWLGHVTWHAYKNIIE